MDLPPDDQIRILDLHGTEGSHGSLCQVHLAVRHTQKNCLRFEAG